MASVIKATDRERAIQSIAFNFDDITAKASQYLDKVRADASQIVAQAKSQAELEAAVIRAKAEEEGRRAGQAAIAQMIQQQLSQQLTTLLPALKQVVQEIKFAKQSWLTHWEKCGLHVATAIARRIVRRELAKSPEITLSLLREALAIAAGNEHIRVHLNPTDHQNLLPQIEMILKEVSTISPTELIADPQIEPGGCRLETQLGVIDQQIETQLARIEEELT
jgi:flagellar assembly protein FliH